MKWKHTASLAWMRQRQKYLTASDVHALAPVSATGRTRHVGFKDYLRVYANKVRTLTEDDCVSTGAAARGHILEPYAIDAYNHVFTASTPLYHWDDVVIAGSRELAFSPDAMDIMPGQRPEDATMIGEVKSYSPERHFQVAVTPLMECEERWQIATAMAVLPNIKQAKLILYNPEMIDPADRLFVKTFHRAELAKTIEAIKMIEDNWIGFKNVSLGTHLDIARGHAVRIGTVPSLEELMDTIEHEQRINPS